LSILAGIFDRMAEAIEQKNKELQESHAKLERNLKGQLISSPKQ